MRWFAAILALAVLAPAYAQYPTKPIRLVVPFAEAAKAAKTPAVAERFAADDAIAVGSTSAEFAAFIKQEQARWSEVVRKAGIKAD